MSLILRRVLPFIFGVMTLAIASSQSLSWKDHEDFHQAIASNTDISVQFPSLEETAEMARLAHLVYQFKKEDNSYCNSYHDDDDDDLRCHWYFHDKQLGTQVMIVSKPSKKYVAVVFAGTDDLKTSLQDLDIAKLPFGNNSTVKLEENSNVLVHKGFDKAVFSGAYEQISKKIKWLHLRHPFWRIYTTGHSLGAADSILTATALAHQGYTVQSISFGCPKTGNEDWRDFLNSTSTLNNKLGIWRVVVGWDLVARLPEFFSHVGHTIQLWSEDHYKYDHSSKETNLVECYYRHYGDDSLGYAGVPAGWNAKPYAFLPGSMAYHSVRKYVQYLELLIEKDYPWVDAFKSSYAPISYDDDAYDEPPDDWYTFDSNGEDVGAMQQ